MIGDTAPKRWRIAVDALAVLTALSLLISGWALYERFSQTNQSRVENRAVWHAVICSIEVTTVKDKGLTADRRRFVLSFYDRLLVDDVHTTGCGLQAAGR